MYFPTMSASPVALFVGKGNLYGFYIENNSEDDIFLQVYDSASTNLVDLNTTTLVFTTRIKASAAFGKDVNDSPFRYFLKGCVVLISSDRSAKLAPVQPATAQFWCVGRTALSN